MENSLTKQQQNYIVKSLEEIKEGPSFYSITDVKKEKKKVVDIIYEDLVSLFKHNVNHRDVSIFVNSII